jgi:hypothetical protein
MPRIADRFIDCAVYIYGSLDDAKSGQRQGGSGFLVMLPMESILGLAHVYVVTNTHVVAGAVDPVVRLNRNDGKPEFLETRARQWIPHPDGDDISVLPFTLEEEHLRHSPIPINIFLTPRLVQDEDVGIGDDTVMVGRFINHEGKQLNTPAVRFGNIAMMPHEKIKSESGLEQESFLVEIRSLPGYSGSAVFIYSPCATNDMSVRRFGFDKESTVPNFRARTPEEKEQLNTALRVRYESKGPYLLGIDWCHIRRKSTVLNSDGKRAIPEQFVYENTGMAGVIPAWKLFDLLHCEELLNMRRKAEKEFSEATEGVALDAAEEGESSFTKEDFESALKKVSKRIQPSQSDEGK